MKNFSRINRLIEGLKSEEIGIDVTVWIKDGKIIEVVKGEEPDDLTFVHRPAISQFIQLQNQDGYHYVLYVHYIWMATMLTIHRSTVTSLCPERPEPHVAVSVLHDTGSNAQSIDG